jgi:hypothetical protein
VVLSADDIRAFTHENDFQLLSLEGVDTQYMWTAWRKRFSPPPTSHHLPPAAVRRVTHAYSFEPVAPNRERHAAISIWMENLPEECDLNNLEVDIDGAPAEPFFIGWPIAEGVRQVNVWLPKGVRTGLLPVELRMNGARLCAPGTVRVIPAGPQVPRIVSITDGVNLVQKNASSSGILKVQLEEVGAPESLTASVGDKPVERLEIKCIDPRAPRHEVNLRLPEGLAPGHHQLLIRVGRWRLPAQIDVLR